MNSQPKKVVLVAPVLPFRGGIAQHSTMLARALASFCDVTIFSFTRQYPMWLFPGTTDIDANYENHREPNTRYLIDSLNPLSWRQAVVEIKKIGPDIIIFPWWTVYWSLCFGFLSAALRSDNREIVFLCHNVLEHESAHWKKWLTSLVFKKVHRFVVHTKQDRDNLINLLPEANVSIHPHPIYDHFPEAKGDLPKRKSLELLFYGFIRPYKGLEDLIDAMTLVRGNDIQLTIAGECWSDEGEIIKRVKRANLQNQIELRLRYHSDQETAELFARADIVVLPYHSATGSGVVPLAYHYHKPVIVTRVGGLPDVVEDQRTGWIIEKGDKERLKEIITAVQPVRLKQMNRGIEVYKNRFTWDSLAQAISRQ